MTQAPGVAHASPPLLFCLPPAGASAVSTYRDWDRALGDLVRVVPLELANRGRRSAEPGYASLRDAAADCAARIRHEAGRSNFALFGHSMGGLLAYELDATLGATGDTQPAAVVIAGTVPPNRPEHPTPIYDWPEDRFLDAIARLGGLPAPLLDRPDVRAFLAATIRNDYRMHERYELAVPVHRVRAPLLVLQGAADPLSRPDDPAHWSCLAAAGVVARTIPAAPHFFPATHRDEMLTIVRDFLARALLASSARR